MLLDERTEYEPFEYPWAYDFWLRHQHSYWNHTKISLQADVHDFNHRLTEKQRSVIGNTLKGFTQTELVVGGEFWSNKPARWFPKPEILLMCLEFGGREMIHTVAYSQVDTNLGLKNYKGFMKEKTVANKINALVGLPGKTDAEKAVSMSVFSAFTEGVNLFSSFAILLNFSRFDLLKGLGKIVNYSILDESEHSRAGCLLFKTFAEEYNLYNMHLKKAVYDAARMSVALEDSYLDKVFELGDIPGISKHQVKQFIRARANQKLNEVGLKTNWKNLDQPAIDEIDLWFTIESAGERDTDFFAGRVTGGYAKGNKNWDLMWDNVDPNFIETLKSKGIF